jgi:hypothetical protein
VDYGIWVIPYMIPVFPMLQLFKCALSHLEQNSNLSTLYKSEEHYIAAPDCNGILNQYILY